MADFCQQCSIEIFDEDHKDLAYLWPVIKHKPGHGTVVLCEGCGPTVVDNEGKCIYKYCLKHGDNSNAQSERGSEQNSGTDVPT